MIIFLLKKSKMDKFPHSFLKELLSFLLFISLFHLEGSEKKIRFYLWIYFLNSKLDQNL